MLKKILIALACIFLVIVCITAYSVTMLMDADGAPVYFLYSLKYWYPDFLYKVGTTPLAVTARILYGRPAVKAAPISEKMVQEAFEKGEFIIIATHGEQGRFQTNEETWISPTGKVYSQVRYLHLIVCEAALQFKKWRKQFPNAYIKSYSGIFYSNDGIPYILFDAPSDLRGYKDFSLR